MFRLYYLTQFFLFYRKKINGKYYKKVSSSVPETNIYYFPPKPDERKDKRKSPPIHETDIDDLPSDRGSKKDIMDYPANQSDEVRRRYLTKGPCQPYSHKFKQISKGVEMRRFNLAWFDQYGSWLEYSISKQNAFFLYCYLFKDEAQKQGGSDAFVKEGFNS